MSRARRMLEAQKKRDRDELPLEAVDGGLRRPSLTSSPAAKRPPLSRSESREEPDLRHDRSVSTGRKPHSTSQPVTASAPPPSPQGVRSTHSPPSQHRDRDGIVAKAQDNRHSSDEDVSDTHGPRSGSRSASPPPLCVTSSPHRRGHTAVIQPLVSLRSPGTNTCRTEAATHEGGRAASGRKGKVRRAGSDTNSPRYPAHRLQLDEDRGTSECGGTAGPLSAAPWGLPPMAPTARLDATMQEEDSHRGNDEDRDAHHALPSQHSQPSQHGKPSVQTAASCVPHTVTTFSRPSPSSPSSSCVSGAGPATQRPAFRAVVSPGMLPQHLSRAASRHGTPMLSQQPPPLPPTPSEEQTPRLDALCASQAAPLTGTAGEAGQEREGSWPLLPPSANATLADGRVPSASRSPPTSSPAPGSPWHSSFPAAPPSPQTVTAACDEENATSTATSPALPPTAAAAVSLSPGTARVKAEWEQAPPAQPASFLHGTDPAEPHLDDYSGFRNVGNDCYACSVLTLLLRNETFREGLLYSPLLLAWRLYHGTALRVTSVESGYRVTEGKKVKRAKGKAARAADEAIMAALEARCGYRITPDDADMLIDEEEDDDDDDGSEHGATEGGGLEDVSAPRAVNTVHTTLAALVSRQQKRELIVSRVNDPHTPLATRQYLLNKITAASPYDSGRPQPYYSGVSMAALASFFHEEFFMGYQEDAHEFLVALVNKLEEEAVTFEKRRRALLQVREEEEGQASHGLHTPHDDDDAEDDGDDDANKTHSGDEAGSNSSSNTAEATAATTAALVKSVWVNQLLQGRLLSINRCRHAGCGHEIVTEEPFMNLTLPVSLPSSTTTTVAATTTTVVCSDGETDEEAGVETKEEVCDEGMRHINSYKDETNMEEDDEVNQLGVKQEVHDAPKEEEISGPVPTPNRAVATTSSVPSVAALLRHTMQYDRLEGYACDVCQTRGDQWQGGCFLGSPPPLLLVQLKRFAVTFVNGEVIITKEGCPVKVDSELTVHALVDETNHAQADLPDAKMAPHRTPIFYDAAKKAFSPALHALEGSGQAHDGDDDAGPRVPAVRAHYRLQGIVLHLGTTLHFGHYIAEFATKEDREEDYHDETDHADDDDHCDDDEEQVDANDYDGNNGSKARSARHKRERAGSEDSQCTPARGTRFVWRVANDSRVRVLNEAVMTTDLQKNTMCYLLLYEKVSEKVEECSLWSVIPRGSP